MMVSFSFVMNCSVNSHHFVVLKLFVFANGSSVFLSALELYDSCLCAISEHLDGITPKSWE